MSGPAFEYSFPIYLRLGVQLPVLMTSCNMNYTPLEDWEIENHINCVALKIPNNREDGMIKKKNCFNLRTY